MTYIKLFKGKDSRSCHKFFEKDSRKGLILLGLCGIIGLWEVRKICKQKTDLGFIYFDQFPNIKQFKKGV